MTVGRMIVVVVAFGAATAAVQLAGWGDLGGLMALVQLGGLIGAPMALILNRHLRSTAAAFALSIALSIALSALSVQSLIWFTVATRLSLIVTGTLYGAGLAWLLAAEPDTEQVGRS
jgi:hypothetical protein